MARCRELHELYFMLHPGTMLVLPRFSGLLVPHFSGLRGPTLLGPGATTSRTCVVAHDLMRVCKVGLRCTNRLNASLVHCCKLQRSPLKEILSTSGSVYELTLGSRI